MIAFHDVLHKVYEQLNREEKMGLKAELKKTPFWNLIEAYDKGLMTKNTAAKSDREMHRLVQCYKPALKKFKFGRSRGGAGETWRLSGRGGSRARGGACRRRRGGGRSGAASRGILWTW
ncbi:hypothetical protein ABKV19_014561 [Rosa sericea]